MQTAVPSGLLGRGAEIAALERAIRTLAQGRGSVLVLEGPAGTGKTRLLEELVRRVPDARRARAVELDANLPLGVATRMLEESLRTHGIGWRRSRISGTTLAEAGAGPLYELAQAAIQLVARTGPQVLVVDDAQWADRQSLELFAYLAGLAVDLPLLVAVGARPGPARNLLAPFGAAPGAVSLTLADLSEDQASDLVRLLLPNATTELVEVCVRVSGGNPLLVHELTSAIAANGTAAHPETARRIEGMAPRTVTDGVLTRLGQIGSAAVELARAVAILGDGTSLRHAARLADLDADTAAGAADRLVQASILAQGPDLSFLHPLLSDAVLRDLGEFTRARRYRRAAQVVAADGLADRAGAHLLRAHPADDPTAVDLLRAAAAEALARGDAHTGARLLERALAEPPTAAERPAVLIDLARAEAATGDVHALDHLEDSLSTLPGPPRRITVLDELSRLLYLRSDFRKGVQVAERALADVPTGHPDHERLRATWLLSAGMLPESHGRTLEITRQLAAAALQGQPPHDPDLRAIAALNLLCRGVPDCATELAAAALAGGLDVNGPGAGYALSVLAWAGQRNSLAAAAARVHREASEANSLLGMSLAAYWQGRAHLDGGDLAAALESIRGARAAEELGWHAYRPLTAALLAEVRMEYGDLADAESAIRDVPADEVPNPLLCHLRGRLALAKGDHPAAAAAFATAGEVLQNVWAIDGPVVVPWRSGAALAALGTGERQRALELSAADVDLARADGIPVGLARTLRARGLVVGDEDGLALLREAAAAAAASESVLEQTHAGVELGAALRRSGARREARTILAEARERAESSGLGALAQRARDEQQASGARPRRVSLTGPAALTPSELRIARLAAAGATNQQIAAELHLSPKTVSWHLGAIFRKLAITRRQALAAALEGDRA